MAVKKKYCDEKQIMSMIEEGVKKFENMNCMEKKGIKKHASSGAAGTIWFLGFVGATVYFIQQATSFGAGVLGFLKALVWPAFIIYHLLDFLRI